jgi:MFS family permease
MIMAGLGRRFADLTGELRNPEFRRLWLAQVVSEIGDWASRLALATLVYSRTHSATWASLVAVSALVPMLGPGQWLASFADRLDRRHVMITADVVRVAVFGAIALDYRIWVGWVFAACVLAGLATVPFEAARSAATLDLVPAERLPAALGLGQATQSLALMAGWVVGGAMLALVGTGAALGVNAASFAASALILLGIHPLRITHDGSPRNPTERATVRLRAAAHVLWSDDLVRRCALLATFAVAPATATMALVVPFVSRMWGIRPALCAVLLAAGSAVELLLTVFVAAWVEPGRLLRRAGWCAVVPATLAIALFSTGQPLLQAAGFVAAAGCATVLVPAAAALGPRLPPDLRASCYTLLGTALTAAQVGLTALAGILADRTSPALAACGVLSVGVVAGTVVLVGRAAPSPAGDGGPGSWRNLGEAGVAHGHPGGRHTAGPAGGVRPQQADVESGLSPEPELVGGHVRASQLGRVSDLDRGLQG